MRRSRFDGAHHKRRPPEVVLHFRALARRDAFCRRELLLDRGESVRGLARAAELEELEGDRAPRVSLETREAELLCVRARVAEERERRATIARLGREDPAIVGSPRAPIGIERQLVL